MTEVTGQQLSKELWSDNQGEERSRRDKWDPDDLLQEDWVDITREFFESSSKLNPEELLHDSNFSLFEAMSAIELMDPKMDSGVVKTKKPQGFFGAVESGRLEISEIHPEKLIETIDATWACFVTWLEGHSLAQTLFTNLYLHQPTEIEDKIMRSFAIGMIKLIAVSREIVLRAQVFEEEDFQPTTHDFYLVPDMELGKVLGFLKEAEDETQKKIRHCRGTGDNVAEASEGVLSRIRFLRHFLTSLLYMVGTNIKNEFSDSKTQNLAEADKSLAICEQILESISNPDIDAETSKSDGDFCHLMAFEPNVNQKLLPPTFPRRTRMYSRAEAMAYMQGLTRRLQLLIITLPQQAPLFGTALLTYLSGEILGDQLKVMHQIPLIDTVLDSLRGFVNPPVMQNKSTILDDELCSAVWTEVKEDFFKLFPLLIQIPGHNRARQREKLAVVLEDLASLQEECEKADSYFNEITGRDEPKRSHVGYLNSFVLYHTLQAMLEYFLLGLELQLFVSHEFPCIFWYMGEVVYKWLATVVNRAGNFIHEQDQWLAKKEKKKGKGHRKKRVDNKLHRIEQVHWQNLQSICLAYFKTLLGLKMMGKLKIPDHANSIEDQRLRYEHRMSPFATLTTPAYVNFQQYAEMSGYFTIEQYVEPSKLLNEAAKMFEDSRTMLEQVPLQHPSESAALIKVCKTNAVVLRLLGSGRYSSDSSSNLGPSIMNDTIDIETESSPRVTSPVPWRNRLRQLGSRTGNRGFQRVPPSSSSSNGIGLQRKTSGLPQCREGNSGTEEAGSSRSNPTGNSTSPRPKKARINIPQRTGRVQSGASGTSASSRSLFPHSTSSSLTRGLNGTALGPSLSSGRNTAGFNGRIRRPASAVPRSGGGNRHRNTEIHLQEFLDEITGGITLEISDSPFRTSTPSRNVVDLEPIDVGQQRVALANRPGTPRPSENEFVPISPVAEDEPRTQPQTRSVVASRRNSNNTPAAPPGPGGLTEGIATAEILLETLLDELSEERETTNDDDEVAVLFSRVSAPNPTLPATRAQSAGRAMSGLRRSERSSAREAAGAERDEAYARRLQDELNIEFLGTHRPTPLMPNRRRIARQGPAGTGRRAGEGGASAGSLIPELNNLEIQLINLDSLITTGPNGGGTSERGSARTEGVRRGQRRSPSRRRRFPVLLGESTGRPVGVPRPNDRPLPAIFRAFGTNDDTSRADYEFLLELVERMGEVVPSGLNPAQINSIPTRVFDPATDMDLDDGQSSCRICISDYNPGDQLRILNCHHNFHQACVDHWLKQKRTCPICRSVAVPSA